MNNITPKEAIANLNHIYGMVAPDIQRSLDVAIKALENQTTEGDLISREALKKDLISYVRDKFEFVCLSCVLDEIDNAPSVEYTFEKAFQKTVCEQRLYCPERPQGDCISREALRKHAIWTKVNNGAELIDIEVVPLVAIDNAPTVPQINIFCETADETAIEDMKAELQSVIESRPQGDLISRSELLKHSYGGDYDGCGGFTREYVYVKDINNAPTVEPICPYLSDNEVKQPCLNSPCERPQGKWYDFIPNCLKARHGEYVLYKVDFLLDNLAREVSIMESARRMKGGAE